MGDGEVVDDLRPGDELDNFRPGDENSAAAVIVNGRHGGEDGDHAPPPGQLINTNKKPSP